MTTDAHRRARRSLDRVLCAAQDAAETERQAAQLARLAIAKAWITSWRARSSARPK
jgi:hypothetical protein